PARARRQGPRLSTLLTNKPDDDASGESHPASGGGAKGAAPASRSPWWASGAVLLGVAVAGVLAWIVAINSGADPLGMGPRRTGTGAALNLANGSGYPSGTSFVPEWARDGIVTFSTEIPPFAAEKYPRIEWDLRSVNPPSELAFAWRTRENP